MKLPGDVGRRLLPSYVDEIAKADPDRVLYSVTKAHDPKDGFQDITSKAFARAVDRCAWHIENNLGRGWGQDFPTLCYMGPQDLVYGVVVLACVKTGYRVLLNSPRETLRAHLSLLEKTGCDTFLLPPGFPLPVVEQILTTRHMAVLEIPSLQHWVGDSPAGDDRPYPYTKSFDEAKYDPFAVLHTSGSTGNPKPVVQTLGSLAAEDAFTALPSLGYEGTWPATSAGTRIYGAFPHFHCAGLHMLLSCSIFSGFTLVLGPYPPTPEVANAVHVYGNVQESILAPPTLVELAKVPEHLENLSRLRQVTFGGGPLPQAVGDLLASKTRLLNALGSTETGTHPLQLSDPEDWLYMRTSPVLGQEYRHVSGDLYEQFIVRKPELEPFQGIFYNFPDLDEWPMKDLYSKHPTKDDAWLYRGRADDIIVFSSGEKLNPIKMESMINANPAVQAALVAGHGQFQSCLLVEAVQPPTTQAEREVLLDIIEPSVQAANKASPSQGRILSNMILFTTPDKPMPRAGKGTVQRKLTIELYASELDTLYNASKRPVHSSANDYDGGYLSIEDLVKDVLARFTDIHVQGLPPDADLFERGLDSLQVLTISRALNDALVKRGATSKFVEPKTVYSNPSIGALVKAVSELFEGKNSPETAETEVEKMDRLFKTHIADVPITARKASLKPQNGLTVAITGSTGSLGSYILDSLISSPRIAKVYCLNRGPGSAKRQQASQDNKKLGSLPVDRVIYLDANLSKPRLGLSAYQYRQLLEEVTLVIHYAWIVDFNLSFESFAGQLTAVRKLVDFSANSRFGANVFFVSSVSAVSKWAPLKAEQTNDTASIPEAVMFDWPVAHDNGYGQSKLVAERILAEGAKDARIPVTICRVGQVAGPTTEAGAWSRQEWLPSLIASSGYLKKLPESLGSLNTVDWVAVDLLAKSITELAVHAASSNDSGAATVFHAANPHHTTWEKLVPTVARNLPSDVEVVSLEIWVQALRESAGGESLEARNPAVKLVDFFEAVVADRKGSLLLDTKGASAISETLGGLEPVKEEWMENWMRQWQF